MVGPKRSAKSGPALNDGSLEGGGTLVRHRLDRRRDVDPARYRREVGRSEEVATSCLAYCRSRQFEPHRLASQALNSSSSLMSRLAPRVRSVASSSVRILSSVNEIGYSGAWGEEFEEARRLK
jgi:hypothetical protein